MQLFAQLGDEVNSVGGKQLLSQLQGESITPQRVCQRVLWPALGQVANQRHCQAKGSQFPLATRDQV